MPKIFEWKGYTFFFFSDEGEPLEHCHVHIRKGEVYAKIWLEPDIMLAKAYGLNSSEINQLLNKVYEHKEEIKEKWNEYFNQ